MVKRWVVFIIKILLVLMPLHVFVFNLIGSNSVIALWRDFLSVLVFFIVIIRMRKGVIKLDTLSRTILFASIIGFIHALIFHDSNMPILLWVNTYRVYFLPFLIYLIMDNCDLNREEIDSLKHIYIIEASFVCVFGIVQQLLIGKRFIDYMGYRRESITFATGVQRNIGLFDSAKIMGVYLLYAIILCIDGNEKKTEKRVILCTLLVGFVLTFSLSAYIAFIVVLIAKQIMLSLEIRDIFKKYCKWLLLLIVGIAGITLIDNYMLDMMIRRQIFSRFTDLYFAIISNDLKSLTTSSAARHILDMIEPLQTICENPFGVGFSTGTFMVFGKVAETPYAVESSIYTIILDLGLLAGVCYLSPFVQVVLDRKRVLSNYARLVAISLVTVFLGLPIVQSYEIRFFLFLIVALGKNEKRYFNGEIINPITN